MRVKSDRSFAFLAAGLYLLSCMLAGCGPQYYRRGADKTAARIIERGQEEALGRTEPFTIETPATTLRRRLLRNQNLPYSSPASLGTDQLKPIDHWPKGASPPAGAADGAEVEDNGTICVSLLEALQIGAYNSRQYQSQKEDVFRTALAMDLAADEFRLTYAGLMESLFELDQSSGESVRNLANTGEADATLKLKTGATLAAKIAFDLANLLSGDRAFSRGILFDTSISIPLLSGSGEYIVAEPLTQASRNVLYAVYRFERFKKTFAVGVASNYLSVLQQLDQDANARENYKRLKASAQRARARGEAGRLSPIQVDQARQDELSARDRWISAVKRYKRTLDEFKITLGLPADASIELDHKELGRLSELASRYLTTLPKPTGTTEPSGQVATSAPTTHPAGPLEMGESEAIDLALDNRLDLVVADGRVYDAQRGVVVAADALRAGATLAAGVSTGGRRGLGSAGLDNAQLRFDRGVYSAGLLLDLPWEKTAERDAYRNSLIDLDESVRDFQELEDQVKFQVREALRKLELARESYIIQAEALKLAERRVESTNLFLDAGRAEIRDLLEAQESLIRAQDSLTAALVNYRVGQLDLQRDTGVLQVNEKGVWSEYDPRENQ